MAQQDDVETATKQDGAILTSLRNEDSMALPRADPLEGLPPGSRRPVLGASRLQAQVESTGAINPVVPERVESACPAKSGRSSPAVIRVALTLARSFAFPNIGAERPCWTTGIAATGYACGDTFTISMNTIDVWAAGRQTRRAIGIASTRMCARAIDANGARWTAGPVADLTGWTACTIDAGGARWTAGPVASLAGWTAGTVDADGARWTAGPVAGLTGGTAGPVEAGRVRRTWACTIAGWGGWTGTYIVGAVA